MTDSRIKHVTVPGLRLHLRRGEPNMLWINGQDLLLLNKTAAEFIEAFIDVMSTYRKTWNRGQVQTRNRRPDAAKISQVPVEVLIKDFDNIYGTLLQISQGSCPISDVNLETKETDPRLWTAPPRMDLALTYNCNNNCYFCYTGGPQKGNELEYRRMEKGH